MMRGYLFEKNAEDPTSGVPTGLKNQGRLFGVGFEAPTLRERNYEAGDV